MGKKPTNLKECLEAIEDEAYVSSGSGQSVVDLRDVEKYFEQLKQSRRNRIEKLRKGNKESYPCFTEKEKKVYCGAKVEENLDIIGGKNEVTIIIFN